MASLQRLQNGKIKRNGNRFGGEKKSFWSIVRRDRRDSGRGAELRAEKKALNKEMRESLMLFTGHWHAASDPEIAVQDMEVPNSWLSQALDREAESELEDMLFDKWLSEAERRGLVCPLSLERAPESGRVTTEADGQRLTCIYKRGKLIALTTRSAW